MTAHDLPWDAYMQLTEALEACPNLWGEDCQIRERAGGFELLLSMSNFVALMSEGPGEYLVELWVKKFTMEPHVARGLPRLDAVRSSDRYVTIPPDEDHEAWDVLAYMLKHQTETIEAATERYNESVQHVRAVAEKYLRRVGIEYVKSGDREDAST